MSLCSFCYCLILSYSSPYIYHRQYSTLGCRAVGTACMTLFVQAGTVHIAHDTEQYKHGCL